jgi:hypothetical protein
MQKITLYRYNRVEGGVTISPVKPDVEYTELFRLVADEGCILTDGVNHVECVDTDSPEAWEEIAEATDTDYQNALAEFGVEV